MLNNQQKMRLKLLQKESFKKTAEATGDLVGNKIAYKITRSSKTSPQDNLEMDEEILKEKNIFPELIQKLLMI